MTEKEIKDKAELIVEALTALSLGKEPNLLSNDVFKKLADHNNFLKINAAYCDYLSKFNGRVEEQSAIKALFEFRMLIVDLFDNI